MSDTTPGQDPGEGLEFRTGDRVLAAVLLVGALALSYVCLDVMAGGRITATLTRGRTGDDG